MQLQHTLLLPGLAVLLTTLCLSTALPVSGKMPSCCTKVSTDEITDPILSYRFQPQNLPCVNAFIFETAKGFICSAPRQKWVLRTVKELRKLQLQ
ncbi:hypothetical protein ACEWY4_006185 [Coilia grayii]|uniref:Chemokine interleukin-8-like domain-containing protein n=1 Tax=Coilia grayii TaxID=363190 RepID=A0ABD1KDR6_9TELE